MVMASTSDYGDESSFGITWVAFRGTNTTYVAFRKTLDPVRDRLTSYLVYNPASITFDFLGTSIISEVEGALASQKFPETCNGQHVHEPFAIVSVVPDTFNDKGKRLDKAAAVDFLRGKIEKDKIVYPYVAQMAAVGALQILYDQTFEPDDIWVHEVFSGEEQGLSDNDIMPFGIGSNEYGQPVWKSSTAGQFIVKSAYWLIHGRTWNTSAPLPMLGISWSIKGPLHGYHTLWKT